MFVPRNQPSPPPPYSRYPRAFPMQPLVVLEDGASQMSYDVSFSEELARPGCQMVVCVPLLAAAGAWVAGALGALAPRGRSKPCAPGAS